MTATRFRDLMNLGKSVLLAVWISSVVSSALERYNGMVLRRQPSYFGNSHQRGIHENRPMSADYDLLQQRSVPPGDATYSWSGDAVGPFAGLTEKASTPRLRNTSRQNGRRRGRHSSPLLMRDRFPPRSAGDQQTASMLPDQRQILAMVFEQAVARTPPQGSPELPHTSSDSTRRGAEEESRKLDPWVVPRPDRVKRSELEEGRRDLAVQAKKALSGEMRGRQRKPGKGKGFFDRFAPGWVGLEAGAKPGGTSKQLRRALEAVLPIGTVYNARDEDEEFRRVGLGKVLGVGASGVVCHVQDMTNMAAAEDFAGKFFYDVLGSDSARAIERGTARIEKSLSREVSARSKVLAKASEDDLLRNGVAVAHGLYTLDSRSPGPVSLDFPLLFRPESAKVSPVLFSRIILIMPLLGPSLREFRSRAYTGSSLKYVVYALVTSVAYLNSLGLVHSDVKPSNTAVDPETGSLFLVDLELIQDAGSEQKCSNYLTIQYADPERARCYIRGQNEFQVSEWVDSWALGVTLFSVLCDQKLPFGESPIVVTDSTVVRHDLWFSWILRRSKRRNFSTRSCDVLDETRAALLDIVKLLVDPQKSTRWTAQQLVEQHPFFQVEEDWSSVGTSASTVTHRGTTGGGPAHSEDGQE